MISDDHSQPPPAERFATLDAYLAWRKAQGATDAPYYDEVRPGLYQYKVGRAGGRLPPQLFTREELMLKYGFTR
jgi:hypothetical protein